MSTECSVDCLLFVRCFLIINEWPSRARILKKQGFFVRALWNQGLSMICMLYSMLNRDMCQGYLRQGAVEEPK